jgi:Cu(I)/Ag(I) efflux system membrane protein CusA/SilA
MIDRTIEASIRHRWLVCAAGLALGVWGAWAAWQTPIDAIPDLSENQVIVLADWREHGPEETQEHVTQPLADALKGLTHVRTVRTSSDVGFSMIHVIFDDWANQAAARREVAERLAAAVLPDGVRPRLAPDAPATGQIYWYVLDGGRLDLGQRRRLQDALVGPRLSAVSGVAEVAPVGGFTSEVAVEVDPRELAARGIALESVAAAIASAGRSTGGQIVNRSGAEFVVRSAGGLSLDELGQLPVSVAPGQTVPLADLAAVRLVPAARRGVLEMNGSETVGGVVLMRRGENPLAVTRRLEAEIEHVQAALPPGVRIVTGYDRTPLVRGAIGTTARTLLEALVVAGVCVILILAHIRSSLVVAIALPLATLAAFALAWALRGLGWAGETNIMSLAGLAISVGVLVDSSIVMTENVMHRLRKRFGDEPVRGDVLPTVTGACQTVGRPIVFSVLILLLSFVPVFALGGLEGKMFRPLATTKSLALLASAILAVTVVPALCAILVRGRIRGEQANWIVRSVAGVYRPVLSYLLDRPAVMVWIMGLTILFGFAPLGSVWILRATLLVALLATVFVVRGMRSQVTCVASFLLAALIAPQVMQPLPRAFLAPLDEGTVMDMPITVPRISVAQATDDLKARNMILCRFPEVAMVMGKAGRAETATDPAPIDIIETMINFRPRDEWPRRKLSPSSARRQTEAAHAALVRRGLVKPALTSAQRELLCDEATASALFDFDAQLREFAWQRQQEQLRELRPLLVDHAVQQIASRRTIGPLPAAELESLRTAASDAWPADLMGPPSIGETAALANRVVKELGQFDPEKSLRTPGPLWSTTAASPAQQLHAELHTLYRRHWRPFVARLDAELAARAAELYTRLVLEELLARGEIADPRAAAAFAAMQRQRTKPPRAAAAPAAHHGVAAAPLPDLEPVPGLAELQAELAESLARGLVLLRKERADLAAVGGEFDQALQMPGWANVWTMPIQNRVDMLSTGVNTDIGIRVLGQRLEDVARASDEIAAVVKKLPGAAGVVSDPIRGKGYLDVQLDRAKIAGLGLDLAAVQDALAAALGGKVLTRIDTDRGELPLRLAFPRAWREDEEALRSLPLAIPREGGSPPGDFVPLGDVATIEVVEGPATIKGENGQLRSYVRLNVRGRSASQFVGEARRAIADAVRLPAGVHLEWTGQFEHQERSFARLAVIVPVVVASILLLLYWTYRDLADALLMMLAVPGAIAGGVLLQWLLGETLSVTVVVGYIACFGMATATGVIMLVYLREAVENAGGTDRLTLDELRRAVLDGAVHRLRPKLLTEATTILGLAPILWASGVGAEVIRPMAVPVLGGILIADEVVDLFLPVMFYWVRRRRILARQAAEETGHELELPAAA